MRISKKSDLPKWFKLADYEIYKDMKDDDITYQLYCRCNAMLVNEYKGDNFFGEIIRNGIYGNEPEEVTAAWEKVDFDKSLYLSKGSAVSPLSVRDLRFMSQDLASEKNININERTDNDFKDRFLHVSALNTASVFFDGFYCKINIMKHDDIILGELKDLLKSWREKLDFAEPEPLIKNSWDVIRGKIIDYNAIPLIDLMLWEMATGHKITTGVLAVTLFPEGEYDSIQINQTIKKFAMALLDYGTIEKIEHEISTK